jgi:hypothetical protein
MSDEVLPPVNIPKFSTPLPTLANPITGAAGASTPTINMPVPSINAGAANIPSPNLGIKNLPSYGGVQNAALSPGGGVSQGGTGLAPGYMATMGTATPSTPAGGGGGGSAIGTTLLTAAAPLSFIPVIGPVLSGLAAVGGVIATWFGMGQAGEAADKAAAEEKRRYELESAKEEKRYQEGLSLTKRQMAQSAMERKEASLMAGREFDLKEKTLQREFDYKDKELAEQARVNRINQASQVVAGFLRFANSPENRAAYAQIWRR